MKIDDSAFTLIELLVVMAIIGILCGLSIAGSQVYRQRSYAALVQSSGRQAWTALEASVSDYDSEPDGWYGAWSNTPGRLTSWDGRPFLPGYINPKDIQINAFYNSWCASTRQAWCMERGVSLQHCRSGRTMWWFQLADGTEMKNEIQAMPWC